jgi:hypothetical protein
MGAELLLRAATADADGTNTATEETLLTRTIPSTPVIDAGDLVIIRATLLMAAPTGAQSHRTRFKVGGTTIAEASNQTITATGTMWHQDIVLYIINDRCFGQGLLANSGIALPASDLGPVADLRTSQFGNMFEFDKGLNGAVLTVTSDWASAPGATRFVRLTYLTMQVIKPGDDGKGAFLLGSSVSGTLVGGTAEGEMDRITLGGSSVLGTGSSRKVKLFIVASALYTGDVGSSHSGTARIRIGPEGAAFGSLTEVRNWGTGHINSSDPDYRGVLIALNSSDRNAGDANTLLMNQPLHTTALIAKSGGKGQALMEGVTTQYAYFHSTHDISGSNELDAAYTEDWATNPGTGRGATPWLFAIWAVKE